MSFIYSFTTSPGFATNENVTLIQSDIESSILVILTNINIAGDCMEIEFETVLSQEDEILLHQIISNRDTRITKTYVKTYYPEVNSVSSASNKNIGNFSFQGSKYTGDLRGIDVMSHMDNGLTSYTVEIVNRFDNSIVCSETLTNTEPKLNTMTIVTQPVEPCVLQVSIRILKSPTITNVLFAHIQEVNLWI